MELIVYLEIKGVGPNIELWGIPETKNVLLAILKVRIYKQYRAVSKRWAASLAINRSCEIQPERLERSIRTALTKTSWSRFFLQSCTIRVVV